MRKSGWAAAAGLVSAALLLTACGGSGSTGASGTSSATAVATSAGSGSSAGANPTASSVQSSPPPGALYFIVQKTAKGWVLAEASGKVVYTYAGDTAGKASTCTGACASAWPAVKGVPFVSVADKLPGKLGTIDGQITYNGLPLYTFAGELPIVASHASSQWHLIQLSLSDVQNA
jgi:predicted lipoprotein with Yx(FWY)xxD motif